MMRLKFLYFDEAFFASTFNVISTLSYVYYARMARILLCRHFLVNFEQVQNLRC